MVILPDNDLPGWRYAQKAVDAIFPIAKNIKVVDLGLQGKGDDAWEFVHEMGKKREDLIELVLAAQRIMSPVDVTMPERLQSIPASSTKKDEIYTQDDDHVKKQAEIEQEFAPDPAAPASEAAPTKDAKPPKVINIEAWDDIQDEPVEWLIQGILPVKAFAALYGPPGSFKSFIALDMAEAIATGRPWMGHEIEKQGAVLYLCGEGFGGMGARIRACQLHHNTPKGAPIYVIRHQLNLRSSTEDFNALMVAIVTLVEKTGHEFQLMVVDTLARAFGGGNENESDAMGAFIATTGKIQEFLKCALMVLHHSGKDLAKGLRGHSSLLGAVDTQLEILRFEEQQKGVISLTKQKDGADGVRIGFEMVDVQINESTLGFDAVTSLTVQASDEAVNQASKRSQNNAGKGRNQSIEMSSLGEVIKQKGIYKVVEGRARTVVNLSDWRDEFRSKKGVTDDSSANEKKAFDKAWSRAQDRLQQQGEIGIRDKLVWLELKDVSEEGF